MITAGFLAPDGCWDSTQITDLLDGTLWPHGLNIKQVAGYPNTDGAIVIVPGRYWAAAEINEAIARYKWLLLIITGDEEGLFDSAAVVHPNARFWIQTPRKGREYPGGARFFGVGYTPHTSDLPPEPPDKGLDVFLSAQRTHIRRMQAFDALRDIPNSRVIPTEGFTQGISRKEYAVAMASAKVAPCPSGAVSPDSFRLFEALQAHCVPIADAVSPVDGDTDYWDQIFCSGAPFPVLRDYESLPGYIDEALETWPANANRIAAWWMLEKRAYAVALRDDLNALGAL